MATEQEKADLSKTRGKTAADLAKQGHFASQEDEQKFISAQGDKESKGKLTDAAMEQLKKQGTMSFKKGTTSVPKTGKAVVHEGEAVIPKDKAKKSRGVVEGLLDATGDKNIKAAKKEKGAKEGTKKAPKHRVHTMHIKRAKGGFVVDHDVEPGEDGSMPTPEQNPSHVVSDMQGLQDHVEEHMGDEDQGTLASAQPSPAMSQA